MNQYRIRLVRSIINRLGAMVAANGALYGVEARLRRPCEQLVLEVAGATISHRDNLPVAVLSDGTTIATDGDHPDAERAVAIALERWNATGRPPPDIARALPLASGAEALASRLGGDIDRMAALAYAFYSATIGNDHATLTISNHGHRLHAIYRRGTLRWEDGVVSMPSTPLPQMLRIALAGRSLSAVVEDDVIGGCTIARVVDADRRERILRIHTADAGRFI